MLEDTVASPRPTFISKLSVAGHAPLTVVVSIVQRPSYLVGRDTGFPAAPASEAPISKTRTAADKVI